MGRVTESKSGRSSKTGAVGLAEGAGAIKRKRRESSRHKETEGDERSEVMHTPPPPPGHRSVSPEGNRKVDWGLVLVQGKLLPDSKMMHETPTSVRLVMDGV